MPQSCVVPSEVQICLIKTREIDHGTFMGPEAECYTALPG